MPLRYGVHVGGPLGAVGDVPQDWNEQDEQSGKRHHQGGQHAPPASPGSHRDGGQTRCQHVRGGVEGRHGRQHPTLEVIGHVGDQEGDERIDERSDGCEGHGQNGARLPSGHQSDPRDDCRLDAQYSHGHSAHWSLDAFEEHRQKQNGAEDSADPEGGGECGDDPRGRAVMRHGVDHGLQEEGRAQAYGQHDGRIGEEHSIPAYRENPAEGETRGAHVPVFVGAHLGVAPQPDEQEDAGAFPRCGGDEGRRGVHPEQAAAHGRPQDRHQIGAGLPVLPRLRQVVRVHDGANRGAFDRGRGRTGESGDQHRSSVIPSGGMREIG